VPQRYLDAIADQAQRHQNIPLTHFFNPRIYLPEVLSPGRAAQLTDWVLDRGRTRGDEIQLHLHMHFDMLQAAGVEPKTEPKWGFRSNEGYDVFTTAYSREEFGAVLGWAEQQFRYHGLPEPVGYRAGGWFADLNILHVLEQHGYTYDASGRERRMWGGGISSPWNLDADTQPYYPARADQNRTGPTTLDLLEIPNNGGDAYGYTAAQMIERLMKNYPAKVAQSRRVVTFLSHPQWHDKDQVTMDAVLDFTDAKLYQTDQGPFVYVTLSQIADLWKK
jgi:hypothetical protein